MNEDDLFRPGERIQRWPAGREPGEPGATISVTTLSELAHAWWGDRISPGWRPRTREHNRAILDRLGLTGDFWHLAEA
jgi:hypothetical protein